MEEYTIIYGEFFMCGSHRNQIVKYMTIKCNPEDLVKEVENTVGMDCVHFIFKGCCEKVDD